MTAQMPDEVVNLDPRLNLGDLRLYAVVQGDITADHGWGTFYPFQRKPTLIDERFWCSALWRGYVAHYRIDAEARVTLVRFGYPFRHDLPEDERAEDIGEELIGDYWLVFKDRFFGPRTYVPARDGRVVPERDQWSFEPDPGPSMFDDV
jgi:hypothetical protein